MNKYTEEYNKFFNRLYDDMAIEHITDKNHKLKSRQEKIELVKEYIDRQQNLHNKVTSSPRNSDINFLKSMYYDKYVIKKENIPESYYEFQKKIAKERGYGDVQLSDREIEELANTIINDQKKSLDTWIDYLLSDDAKFYPFHLKYWAFKGMLKLGEFDKEKKVFKRRSRSTTNIFADLNREALSLTMNYMNNFLKGESLNDKDLENLLRTNSFQKVYTYFLNKVNSYQKDTTLSNDGIWIKYNRGSDHMPLVKSLEGRGTGWCTAGESVAKSQLAGGDFYVYYTKDNKGEYKIPRIAIRMEGNKIGEIRGVAENQNLESDMEQVVEEKLKEFPDRDEYKKKVSDMKEMTLIYNKFKNNQELSHKELSFLYEINEPITGFGYAKDPRIEEIISTRNIKKDLSLLFNCLESEVALTQQELEENNKNTVILWGNIITNSKYVYFPKLRYIKGFAYFSNLTTAEGLNNLQIIGGDADFNELTTAEGLNNLQTIGGDADFNELTTAEGLNNLQTIGGAAHFDNLTTAEGLNNLQTIGGDARFSSLTTAEGLNSLQTIGGNADFSELTSTEGLNSLQTIGNNAWFSSLTTAEGLNSLQKIGGAVDFSNLRNAEGLNNLQTIGGDANFVNLTTAKGLKGLTVNGEIYAPYLQEEFKNKHQNNK